MLKSLLNEHGPLQFVNVPTQRCGHMLDCVAINYSSLIANLTVKDKLVSDHYVVMVNLKTTAFHGYSHFK